MSLVNAYERFDITAEAARQPTTPEGCLQRALSLEGTLQRLVAIHESASNAFRPQEDPDNRFGSYQGVLPSQLALVPRFQQWHTVCG